MWDDYHVFLIAMLVFTRLLLDEIYHLVELPFEWLIDDAMFVCLLDELIPGLFRAIWHWKPVDSSSHRISPLYYKRTDKPSVLVTLLYIKKRLYLFCSQQITKYAKSFQVWISVYIIISLCVYILRMKTFTWHQVHHTLSWKTG